MQIARLEDNFEKTVKDTASILRGGGIVLYPTDTLYGLAVDANNKEAVQKLIELKGRDAKKAISVVVKDKEGILNCAYLSPLASDLVDKFLPGALTLVLPTKELLMYLSAGGSLGFRIPDDRFTRALSEEFGGLYTATSANVSGQPTMATVQDILQQFGEKANLIDLAVDAGERSGGMPSTVVRVIDSTFEILREGKIKTEEFNLFKNS